MNLFIQGTFAFLCDIIPREFFSYGVAFASHYYGMGPSAVIAVIPDTSDRPLIQKVVPAALRITGFYGMYYGLAGSWMWQLLPLWKSMVASGILTPLYLIIKATVSNRKLMAMASLTHLSTDVECIICNDGVSDVQTPCGHMFHGKCIERWFEENPNCPTCRKELA